MAERSRARSPCGAWEDFRETQLDEVPECAKKLILWRSFGERIAKSLYVRPPSEEATVMFALDRYCADAGG
ncbi:hypothetical protein LMG23992_00357 [Cupriavidus laharis]|uniref:Uncharacterized protein n=1 Tax=Cupriavidus laharis TaxID=151654 RepID=A0ABM8WD35_9BURK|nr:hypothetical protein LMG23992_00357 [Cupriavidus laharis]